MSTVAEKQLALLTAKGVAKDQALSAAKGDVHNAAYEKQIKAVDKIFRQGLKALRQEMPPKELTEKAQALEDLDLLNQTYSAVFEFNTLKEAQAALMSLASDWLTCKTGRHGGNKYRQHHGGPRGCFLITCNKTTNMARLWQADDNAEVLPDGMPGARDIDSDPDDDEHEDHSPVLALLTACAGKSVTEIKAMTQADRESHATKCTAERGITAKDVQALAEKMGCPAEENTKLKRLTWMFKDIGAT